MAQHSNLGASGAYRWMACPASVELSKDIKDKPSKYALEGSAAHWMAEQALLEDLPCEAFVGQKYVDDETGETFELTMEMAHFVQQYVNCVEDIMAAEDRSVLTVEQQFDLAVLNPPTPMWGIGDAVVWQERSRTLTIADLKFGQGTLVEVEGNVQLMYYALGAVLAGGQKPATITVVIVQPRAKHPDGTVRSWSFSYEDLIEFKNELLRAAEYACMTGLDPGPVGPHCKFCRAKAICSAQAENAVVVAQSEFADIETLPDPTSLDPEHMLLVLDKAPQVEGWFTAIREHVHDRLMAGEEVPGWKLVEKRATRKWKDPHHVEVKLRKMRVKVEDFSPRKLLSPAQMEKKLKARGRKLPENLYEKKSSGYNLVHESNPKPAFYPGNEFTAIASADNETDAEDSK